MQNLKQCKYFVLYIYIYIGYPWGDVPDSRKMFLKLKYTNITQNTFIQIWMVMEITAREMCGLVVPHTVPVCMVCCPYTAHVHPSVCSQVKCIHAATSLLTVITVPVTCEELKKCPFCFPTWNVVTCILCMDYGLMNIKGDFPTEGFRLGVYFLIFTRQCMRLVVFQVLLCSLKGRWYHWFTRVQDCPLVEWSLASACHLCRCGELYIRKIYILIVITGYNIWKQGTLLNVWICATG
jgi:hypothetical protein